jgi:non-ribosomal peptide synthetase component F
MTGPHLKGPAVFAALAILTAAAGGVFAQVPPEVRGKAAGIFAALRKIEAEAERTPARAFPPSPAAKPGSRSLTFSEDELNAYAACRLENEPYVKGAVLKLLADDNVEGRITIDLGKPQASGLVPQKQDLLFAARIETRDGKIRVAMDKLFLGTQAISPAFLDIVIGVVSRLQGVEPTTLDDWYDLPPGVLRLESRPGQVVVIY